MTVTRSHAFRWFVALLALAAFLGSGLALGADRVRWKKRTVSESNESWRLDMEFHFSKPPDIAHVPILFEFKQTVYYENSLEDGMEKPQMRRVPVEFKQPLLETQDVGFLDPGTGKTMPRTRFTFKLTRARGFEAGEYKVTVKNKRTGRKLGAPITLTLKGENDVVDRRSIVFDEKKKKKKKDEPKSWEQETRPEDDPNNEAYWAGGPTEEEGEGEESLPPPAHMQENPGACGCRVPGGPSPGQAPLRGGVVLMGLLAGCIVSRRRSSPRPE